MGFIRSEFLDGRTDFELAILGRPHRTRLLTAPLFDAEGLRLRA